MRLRHLAALETRIPLPHPGQHAACGRRREGAAPSERQPALCRPALAAPEASCGTWRELPQRQCLHVSLMTYLEENLHRAGTMGRHDVRKTSVARDGILSRSWFLLRDDAALNVVVGEGRSVRVCGYGFTVGVA